MPAGLAGRGELRGRAERRGLRLLAAGVRVHLGVEHQDVHVRAGWPARDRARRSRCRTPSRRRRRSTRSSSPGSRPASRARPATRGRSAVAPSMPRSSHTLALGLRCPLHRAGRPSSIAVDQIVAAASSRAAAPALCARGSCWSSDEPHAEAELGVVLEERVGPRRPAPVAVGRVRRGGQVAAVDRRAAGGIGDQQRDRRTAG